MRVKLKAVKAGEKKKPRGRPFQKGHPKIPGAGRPLGSTSKVTRAVKEFFLDLTSDPRVQEAIRQQIIDGDRGSMAAFLGAAAYVIGKPKEMTEVDLGPRLAKLLLLAQDRLAERRKAKLISITSGKVLGPGSPDSGLPS